jgi:hypothetical protein
MAMTFRGRPVNHGGEAWANNPTPPTRRRSAVATSSTFWGCLTLAACLAAAPLTGCSSLEEAPTNQALLQDVKDMDRTERQEHLPEDGTKPYPFSIVIAPVQVKLVATEEAPEEGASDEDAAETSTAGATPAPEGGALPAGHALDGGHAGHAHALDSWDGPFGDELVVRYRSPLYRQLLFSPRDPVGDAPISPEDTAGISGPVIAAQGQDGVTYLCPRCLNEVSGAETSCKWCGLAFSPEPAPGAEALAGADGDDAGSEGEAVAGSPPTEVERFICYFCSSRIQPTDSVCPTCGIVLGVEPGYEGALAGGAEGAVGPEQEIGKVGVGAVVRVDQSRAQFGVDAQEVQRDLQEVIDGYGIFDQVISMSTKEVDVERIPPEQQIDALLDYAADNYLSYLLVPVLKKNEVRYVETNGWWWGSMALWVAAWVPSFWVAGEEYEANVEMELQLWDVRAREPVNGWETRYRGQTLERVDQLDRKLNLAWIGWDFLGVPLGLSNLTDGGWTKLSESLSPHAFMGMKREMLEKGFYQTFVAQRLPYVAPVDRQSVALLVGVNKLRAGESQQLPNLLYPIRDVNTVESTLRKVSGWDDDPKPAGEAGEVAETTGKGPRGRVFSYVPNAPSPDRDATLANVRRWLDVDLQTLGPDDAAVLYFSGFGAAVPAARARSQAASDPLATAAIGRRNWDDDYEKYVLMFDTDPNNIPRTALNVKEIIQAVKRCKARRILVVFDCSFANHGTSTIARARTWEATRLKGEERLSQLTNEFLEEFTQRESPKQCVVFSAAGIQGLAWESAFSRPADHGLLTGAFLDGVNGQADVETGDNNGAVELHELQDFISQKFRAFSTASSLDMSFYVAGDPTRMSLTLKPLPQGGE